MAFWQHSISHSISLLQNFLESSVQQEQFQEVLQALIRSQEEKNKVLACGNGGSFCDAMHFIEELTGRYRKDRPPFRGICLGDMGHTTCVSNDYGYDHIFSRLVLAQGNGGDLLFCLSTSGNSPNILLACEQAKSMGIKIVGLTGKSGGKLKEVSDYLFHVESFETDRIQEVHSLVMHMLVEGLERRFYPDHYKEETNKNKNKE